MGSAVRVPPASRRSAFIRAATSVALAAASGVAVADDGGPTPPQATGDPVWSIVSGVVVVLVIGAVALVLRRRRHSG